MGARGKQPGPDGIRPCGGSCGRMTRHSKVPKAAAPDSVVRHNSTHCVTCYRHEVRGDEAQRKPLEVPERRVAATQAAYEMFLRGRAERLARRARVDSARKVCA